MGQALMDFEAVYLDVTAPILPLRGLRSPLNVQWEVDGAAHSACSSNEEDDLIAIFASCGRCKNTRVERNRHIGYCLAE